MSESAVLQLCQRLTDAWNAGDATAYGDLFTADADYVVFNGMHLEGRDAIAESHRWLFDGPLRGTRLSAGSAPATVRFVRPDVAIVISTGGMTMAGEPSPDPGHDSIQTLVAVRGDGGWRLASFQNTRRAVPDGRA
jgi:uncharacterized protein (TIGR02246 family)